MLRFPNINITAEITVHIMPPPGPSGLATLDALEATEKRLMSQISDLIQQTKDALAAATARVQDDVAALNAKIADLQAKVATGLATPEDIQALQEILQGVNGIDPTKSDVIPPVPTPEPTPVVGPTDASTTTG